MSISPPPKFSQAAGFTFAGGKAGSGPPKIEHRIGVKASAAVLWEIMADLPRWSEWNPLYTAAEGELRIGAVLTLTLALPGEAPQVIRPVIVDWVPEDQIHWQLTLLRGLITSIRFIEIEALGEANCIVSNGELFGGLLGGWAANQKRRALREGFKQMSEALAARAEALWRERSPSPTS